MSYSSSSPDLLEDSSNGSDWSDPSSCHVTVIGTGYVGLPLAVLMKDCGMEVTGYDVNKAVVKSLNEGKSTIDDVEGSELKGIKFTSDPSGIKNSDVFVICVPTPVNSQKMPDLSIVKAVKTLLKQVATPGSLIILESTVGVGDTRRVFSDMCNDGFFVVHSPERIDPARKYPSLKDIPKLVGGVNPASTGKAVSFYEAVFNTVVPMRNSDHSEAAKLLENSFRAVNISFINEFSNFCESFGIDANGVIDGASTKPYGFMPFRSWIGVGGHCIPVDPHYLIEGSNGGANDWPILAHAMQSIHDRPRSLAEQRFSANPGMKLVLVCGVSYKPNVSDTRDAPQFEFIRYLKERGVKVDYFDPHVEHFGDLRRMDHISKKVASTYDHVFVMHKHKVCAAELEELRGEDNVEFCFC